MKEIQDQDLYQFSGKLQGGRLNIPDAGEPRLTRTEQWFGGTILPGQLQPLDLAEADG